MSANQFGTHFVVTTFGESHGTAIGVVIDGCPAGIDFDMQLLQKQLARRRPLQIGTAQEGLVTARGEADEPEVLSGVYCGKTLGTPIAILIRNTDARPEDYKAVLQKPRIGHADELWIAKHGHADLRGGGRASGRETASRVMGAAVAQMLLRRASPGLCVIGFADRIGPIELERREREALEGRFRAFGDFEQYPARFPSESQKDLLRETLQRAKEDGDSLGGEVEIWVEGCDVGLGQPVFHKLKADLASAYMGVGACVGVEIGEGFSAARAKGSEFHTSHSSPNYGGIRGGISTGERIVAKVAVKPTSTIGELAKQGRHDPCIVTRVIPVLEAMTWLVLADHVIWRRAERLEI